MCARSRSLLATARCGVSREVYWPQRAALELQSHPQQVHAGIECETHKTATSISRECEFSGHHAIVAGIFMSSCVFICCVLPCIISCCVSYKQEREQRRAEQEATAGDGDPGTRTVRCCGGTTPVSVHAYVHTFVLTVSAMPTQAPASRHSGCAGMCGRRQLANRTTRGVGYNYRVWCATKLCTGPRMQGHLI